MRVMETKANGQVVKSDPKSAMVIVTDRMFIYVRIN